MKLELIQSVSPIIPSKGSNAGKQMFVINAKHWSKQEPKADDTHVCLEEVPQKDKDGKIVEGGATYINVVGFSKDARMSIADKIALVTSQEAAYSTAIAMLLK